MKKVGQPAHPASAIQPENSIQINNLRRIKSKSVKLTLAFVTVFIVCWSPKFVLEMMRLIKGHKYVHRRSTIYEITLFMSYVNESINPVIYAMFDPFFREKIARMLGKKDNLSGYTTDTCSVQN